MTEPMIIGSILLGADEMVGEMVRSRVPRMHDGQWGPHTTLGVVRRGVLVGGVVYHGFRGFDVQMSAAFDTPGWALPGTMRAIFAYPFLDLGCRRVTAFVGRKNKRSRKLVEGLGFALEGVARRGMDGYEDAFLFGMLKEKCKWLKVKEHDSQEDTDRADAA